MSTATRERPILFSGEMVRAILAGRKTQTRRVVKPKHKGGVITGVNPDGLPIESWGGGRGFKSGHSEVYTASPYGRPGDRLWVRETWAAVPCSSGCEKYPDGFDPTVASVHQPDAPHEGWRYRATWDKCHASRWKPSIHMPRKVCRLELEVTGVRVERLQAISEEDAIAEGCIKLPASGRITDVPGGQYGGRCWVSGRSWFIDLWDSINGKRFGCAWADNPWLWVVEFKRV